MEVRVEFDREGFIKAALKRGNDYASINTYLQSQGVRPVTQTEMVLGPDFKGSRSEYLKTAIANYNTSETPIDYDAINTELQDHGFKPLGNFEKSVYEGNLSKTGAVIGGTAGHFVGGPPIATAGGAGGYAAGKNIEDIYKLIQGTYPKANNVGEAFDQSITNMGDASKAGLTAGAISSIPTMISALLHPVDTVKNGAIWARNKLIEKNTPQTNVQSLQRGAEERMNSPENVNYLQSPYDIKSLAKTELNNFFPNINPVNTIAPANNGTVAGQYPTIGTNQNLNTLDVYKNIAAFEKGGNVYNPTTGELLNANMSQARGFGSNAMRDYMNERIGPTAAKMNDIYSTLSRYQGKTAKFNKFIVPGIITSMLLRGLINKTGETLGDK